MTPFQADEDEDDNDEGEMRMRMMTMTKMSGRRGTKTMRLALAFRCDDGGGAHDKGDNNYTDL